MNTLRGGADFIYLYNDIKFTVFPVTYTDLFSFFSLSLSQIYFICEPPLYSGVRKVSKKVAALHAAESVVDQR